MALSILSQVCDGTAGCQHRREAIHNGNFIVDSTGLVLVTIGVSAAQFPSRCLVSKHQNTHYFFNRDFPGNYLAMCGNKYALEVRTSSGDRRWTFLGCKQRCICNTLMAANTMKNKIPTLGPSPETADDLYWNFAECVTFDVHALLLIHYHDKIRFA